MILWMDFGTYSRICWSTVTIFYQAQMNVSRAEWMPSRICRLLLPDFPIRFDVFTLPTRACL